LAVLGAIVVWIIFARKRAATRRAEQNALAFGPQDDVFRPPLDDGDSDDEPFSMSGHGHPMMAQHMRGGRISAGPADLSTMAGEGSVGYAALGPVAAGRRGSGGEDDMLIDDMEDDGELSAEGAQSGMRGASSAGHADMSSHGHYATPPTTPLPVLAAAARRRPTTGDSSASGPTLGFGQAGETMRSSEASPMSSSARLRAAPSNARLRRDSSGLDPGAWLTGAKAGPATGPSPPGSSTAVGHSSHGHQGSWTDKDAPKRPPAAALYSLPAGSHSDSLYGTSQGHDISPSGYVTAGDRTPSPQFFGGPSSQGHGVADAPSPGFLAARTPSSHGHGSSSSEGHRQRSSGSHDGHRSGLRSSVNWSELPPSSFRGKSKLQSGSAGVESSPREGAKSPALSSRASTKSTMSGKSSKILPKAFRWRRRDSKSGSMSTPASSQDVTAYFGAAARQQPPPPRPTRPPPVPTFFQAPGTPPPPASPTIANMRRPHSLGQLQTYNARPTLAALAQREMDEPEGAVNASWAWPGLSPGLTLPPLPSPTASQLEEPQYAPEGLLDPHLASRLGSERAGMRSTAAISLRDHEDYSRPIGAVSFVVPVRFQSRH
jgi:hypothetical protein